MATTTTKKAPSDQDAVIRGGGSISISSSSGGRRRRRRKCKRIPCSSLAVLFCPSAVVVVQVVLLAAIIIMISTTSTTTQFGGNNGVGVGVVQAFSTSSPSSRASPFSTMIRIPPSLISSSSSRTSVSSYSSSSSRMIGQSSLSPSSRTRNPFSTRLTTASSPLEEEGEDDEDNDKSKSNINKIGIFEKAANKFKARPGTYLMIPVIAGCVGWLTNYLAVQMIFYPVQFKGIAIWRRPEVPLGLIGWQGIVPCKTKTMSKTLTTMVTSQLLTIPEAFERLNPRIVARHLSTVVPQLGEAVIQDTVAGAGVSAVAKTTSTTFPLGLWKSVVGSTTSWYSGVVRFFNVQILTGVVKDLIKNSERIFSLENCVVDQMVLDRAKLGQLFQKVGRVELDFLTNSGLWFGFLLGLIQMAVALFWDNPWALSFGGMIVGLATNWLALKWIFEPVYPTKIGPFIVQGMFLKRQKEVAAEFSKFFASKIVTSQQIWNSMLTDPSTTPALTQVLGKHVRRLLSIASFGLFKGAPSPTTIGKVTASTIAKLPSFLPSGLHKYVDSALGLETTLRIQMEAMSPAKFERVLHPIFEEDELTLIIAGGVLGFIAGLVQQGLETGSIKVPPLPKPIQNLIQKFKTAIGKVFRRNGNNGNGNDNGNNNSDGSGVDNGDGGGDGDGVSGE